MDELLTDEIGPTSFRDKSPVSSIFDLDDLLSGGATTPQNSNQLCVDRVVSHDLTDLLV